MFMKKPPHLRGLFVFQLSAYFAPGIQHAHVICPFECGRFLHGFLTHAPLHLPNGLILPFLHPRCQIVQNLTDHLLAFEITSIVLLVAAVGGVVLGMKSSAEDDA